MGSNSKHALSKSHTQLVKGFMGQTTAFDSALVKSNILVMGTCELNGEVRYLNGQRGKGMFTFMVVMIQRIFSIKWAILLRFWICIPILPHRLILNNVLFPAAKKKKLKT
jgi:hypothetical protein